MNCEPSTEKAKTYHFHNEWEEIILLPSITWSVCAPDMSCVSSWPALAKNENLERHFISFNRKYNNDFPPKSYLRKREVHEVKSHLKAQQTLFTGARAKSKVAAVASFRVS